MKRKSTKKIKRYVLGSMIQRYTRRAQQASNATDRAYYRAMAQHSIDEFQRLKG